MALRASILTALAISASASLDCRPNGPVVPRPTDLANSPIFTSALDDLTNSLQQAVDGEINAGFPVENSSFSLAVISTSQEDPRVPLWEFHHLSPRNVNGTKDIGRDSQYLIGSVSKVFSDLVLLKSGVDPDTPAREHLPELEGRINWEEITLRDLGSHQAGIPTNEPGFAEYYYLKDVFEQLGFPPIDESDYPPCGVIALNSECDEKAYFQNLVDEYAVAAPARTPVYSSLSFNIFVLALEGATGKSYAELLDEHINGPLGLTDTAPSPGDDEVAVIPAGESTWGSDYGRNAPGGGLVSTVSDLSTFLHAILNKSPEVLPTHAAINTWLKPRSTTGGLRTLVGLPWEIFRSDKLTPEHPHVVDVYAKGGGAYGYRSQIAVLDEYGIGLVLLSAGDGTALTSLYDAVLGTVVPAADNAAREQAGKYTGTFKADSEGVPVVADLEMDEDSVVITSLTRNGSDIIAGIQEIFNQGLGSIVGFTVSQPRLFPTDIESRSTEAGPDGPEREVVREDWRMSWGNATLALGGDLPGKGATEGDCLMWTVTDWMHYGREPMDRFVFVRDAATGEVLGFEVPFLRAGLLTLGE